MDPESNFDPPPKKLKKSQKSHFLGSPPETASHSRFFDEFQECHFFHFFGTFLTPRIRPPNPTPESGTPESGTPESGTPESGTPDPDPRIPGPRIPTPDRTPESGDPGFRPPNRPPTGPPKFGVQYVSKKSAAAETLFCSRESDHRIAGRGPS